jgi:hypothetical protein
VVQQRLAAHEFVGVGRPYFALEETPAGREPGALTAPRPDAPKGNT